MIRKPNRGLPLIGFATALLFVLAIGIPESAEAKEKRVLKVMTQNLYLGSSLDAALAAQTPEEFLYAVAEIYGTTLFTRFDQRAKAIAETIAQERPDIIGLQEVSKWTSTGPGAPPTMDFLLMLQAELAVRNLSYEVVAVSNNAEIGPVPQVLACSEFLACLLTFNDRDVILRNLDNLDLAVLESDSALYATQLVVNTLGGPVSFDRGWAFFDGKFEGKKFRFINTHLETEAAPPVQEAQGQEFLYGPANTGGAVIAVGDFNSAADGSTTSTYADLTHHFLEDAWDRNPEDPGYTCCQDGTLTNTESLLSTRIDLVLTMHSARALRAKLIGDQPFFQGAVLPFWPSDHAGVIAEIRIH